MTSPAPKRLYITSDHAGVELKASLQKALTALPWTDLGPTSGESVDYPDFADLLCRKILADEKTAQETSLGVLICGSGIGMCIRANRHRGIRAALVEREEAARLAREHNHANVLCLGARDLSPEKAKGIVQAWLEAIPSTEERHQRRVRKLETRD